MGKDASGFFDEESRRFTGIFARGERPDGLDYAPNGGEYLCGLFLSGEPGYDGQITAFLDHFRELYYRFLNGERPLGELGRLHRRLLAFFERRAPALNPLRLQSLRPASYPWKFLDQKGRPFKCYLAVSSDGGKDLRLYFVDEPFELRDDEERGELNLVAKRRILEAVKSLEGLDGEVYAFFDYLSRLNPDYELEKELFNKLWKVETSLAVGFEESAALKPLVTRAGYLLKGLSSEEFLRRLAENEDVLWPLGVDEELPEEEKVKALKEELEKEGHLEWIVKVHDDESFRAKLRDAIARALNEVPKPLGCVCYKKHDPYYYKEAQKRLMARPFFPVLVAERAVLEKARAFLRRALKLNKPYLKLKELAADDRVTALTAEELFPGWERLKKERKFVQEKALLFPAFMLEFGGFLEALAKLERERSALPFLFFGLDTSLDEEDGSYPFWNAVRLLNDYLLPEPFQTVTRRGLSVFNDTSVKNAFTSGLRSGRKVVLKEPQPYRGELLLLVEYRSVYFVNGRAHYAYAPFKVSFTQSGVEIERPRRTYFLLNGTAGDAKTLDELFKRGRVVLITQSPDGPAENRLRAFPEADNFVVYYRELKTLTPVTQRDPKKEKEEALVIFRRDFEKGAARLKLRALEEFKEYALLAVKAPFVLPPQLKEAPYVSHAVSLFFVDGLKDVEPTLQEQVVKSLIAWLTWESEAAFFSYAKPKFPPLRLPSLELRVRRDDGEEVVYEFHASALAFELAYLLNLWRHGPS
ncbi:MAG: hypothetical protein GXO03_06165 [Aquificae bacterium]|nr:hypothetical protein [Aquificota bacterium]